ncbi:MAG: hypothetical protein GF353_15075 [Candidatus Lokiarchaeota archaeon]|nr:hypothetical protein [Candidatus Lokiarchaeota archaeon]
MQENIKRELEENLPNFHGTANYYRHSIGNFKYTDGVKYLAEKAQCYWLLDVVGSYQYLEEVKNAPFQLWELITEKDQTAVVTMKEDSDMPDIIKQKLPYTDFPLEKIRLYLVDNVLMLTSEY